MTVQRQKQFTRKPS